MGKNKILKLSEGSIGDDLYDFEIVKELLNKTHIPQT